MISKISQNLYKYLLNSTKSMGSQVMIPDTQIQILQSVKQGTERLKQFIVLLLKPSRFYTLPQLLQRYFRCSCLNCRANTNQKQPNFVCSVKIIKQLAELCKKNNITNLEFGSDKKQKQSASGQTPTPASNPTPEKSISVPQIQGQRAQKILLTLIRCNLQRAKKQGDISSQTNIEQLLKIFSKTNKSQIWQIFLDEAFKQYKNHLASNLIAENESLKAKIEIDQKKNQQTLQRRIKREGQLSQLNEQDKRKIDELHFQIAKISFQLSEKNKGEKNPNSTQKFSMNQQNQKIKNKILELETKASNQLNDLFSEKISTWSNIVITNSSSSPEESLQKITFALSYLASIVKIHLNSPINQFVQTSNYNQSIQFQIDLRDSLDCRDSLILASVQRESKITDQEPCSNQLEFNTPQRRSSTISQHFYQNKIKNQCYSILSSLQQKANSFREYFNKLELLYKKQKQQEQKQLQSLIHPIKLELNVEEEASHQSYSMIIQVKDKNQQLMSSNQKIQSLQKELQSMKDKIDKIATLKQQQDQTKEQRALSQKELLQNREIIDKLKMQVQLLHKNSTNIEAQIKAKIIQNEQIKRTMAKYESLISKNNELQQKINSLTAQNQLLTIQITNLTNNIREITTKLNNQVPS